MELFTAPDYVPFDDLHDDDEIVFLAGSIEQGKAKNWQQRVIAELDTTDAVVFNPRREDWDSSWEQSIDNPQFAEQVNCELDHLEYCTIAFFYFQAGTQSPISLAELGKMLELHETTDVMLVVVCEPDFWRRGNIDIMCARAEVQVHDTLDRGILHLLDLVQPE